VSAIVRSVGSIPEVQAVFTLAGDPDALVQVRVRDLAHLQLVIDTLRRSGTVTGTRTLMVLGSWERRD
jgi:DNA-binding Lrp family transcriptional regulator